MTSKIISAFPGTGKTYYCKNNDSLDSDSSKYSKSPDFPNNYIQHIKDNLGKVDIIFVSSHKVVRDALVDSGLVFALVYPLKGNKAEYLKRFKDRGNDENFINMIDENWDNFLDELANQTECIRYTLLGGQYISDIMEV